ncbi:lactonase family protein, partial [candidate division KSB1 bacterium]|nr:lactonase family protein [candidate division KSB1 bacterium]NIS46555.1 lactonase family protein [candidate division Zixibacteria bacterium]NIT71868.1 lactonase family protein [candidate division KSB1 bacterium]NIX71548.1 beta-propeller fold lactonase family protein [candidate division KSB1 bacterium]
TGFRLSSDGKLSPIAGSTRPLSSRHLQTAPAQIQFTPNGEQLVVTEKATNVIDTYAINSSGLADGPKVQFSAGDTPFGFDFNKSGHLIVSEAFGGEPKASAVSSYQVSRGGEVQLVTESQATNQSAGCWVVVTKNGRFAYVSNTKSGTISGFKIRRDGSIALLNDDGLTADIEAKSFPIDMALSRSGGYLHVLNAGLGEISTFQVQKDGSLEIVPGVDEPNQLPVSAGVQGLAAF